MKRFDILMHTTYYRPATVLMLLGKWCRFCYNTAKSEGMRRAAIVAHWLEAVCALES